MLNGFINLQNIFETFLPKKTDSKYKKDFFFFKLS